MAGWIKMLLRMEVGLRPGHCVRWGPNSPKREQTPNFRPMSIVAKRLGGSRWHLAWRWPRSRLHRARWGPSYRDTAPIFGPCLCGQTAGWIRIPLDTQVGLGPGDIVLDGDLAPRERGTAPPPLFGPCLCGHGRPSQLLLSSCSDFPENQLNKSYSLNCTKFVKANRDNTFFC